MARKPQVQWPHRAAESENVWTSSSDGALHVWLRSSPVDMGRRSTSFIDRLLPLITVVLLATSGLIIGWVLFTP